MGEPNSKIGERGRIFETEILGLGIDACEMARAIELSCYDSVHSVRPFDDHLKVVVKPGASQERVERSVERIKLELHTKSRIARRLREIRTAVCLANGQVEVRLTQLEWLSNASLISVLVTLRGHAAVVEAVSLVHNEEHQPTKLVVSPASDAVRQRVTEVLEAKARHVRVTLPRD